MRIAILLIVSTFIFSCSQSQERIRQSFNEDWVFSKGEIGQEALVEFDDSDWSKLDVPHDWAIEGPFDAQYDARTGGLPIFGTAWYRKHFVIDDKYKGKKVTIEFDGVMNNAEVYLNGEKVGERPYGYIGFETDLTPYLKFGEENILAVRVDPQKLSARWYPGAGIYRNVWLEIKSQVHIAHWGTYITTPEVSDDKAIVNIETTLENKNNVKGSYKLKTIISDAKGNEVATANSKVDFGSKSNALVNQSIVIDEPIRWDMDQPHLYTAKSVLYKGKTIIDTYKSSFGVRMIEYSQKSGFLLNGNQVRFKGVCLHHDLGPLGAAVNYRATQRQLEIMKSMGVNAIRTSHNPPSPEQLELCDKMGILVQVEAFDEWAIAKVENGYNKFWDEWHETDLRDMIKRDRNHPSVVMWSIGNEIREQQRKNGGEVATLLTQICHDEDPTRPVSAGFNNYPACVKNGLADAIDLVGLNYKPTQYDNILEKNPDFIVYGSETSSCVSSRGVYHLPLENYDKHESLQITSYDIISPPWAYPPDFEIYAQETMPHSLGEFVWTGIDYLGEPTPFNGRDNETDGRWTGDWPSRSSYFGAVDLAGLPKDRFYFYQSRWTKEPLVHILPHWNWENSKYKTIPVYCYTNCDEAELFLNGKSLGKKVMGVDKTTIPAEFAWWKKEEKTWDSPYRLNWNVDFEPGELKVVAYKEGEAVVEKIIRTAGKPHHLILKADRNEISANGSDLSYITVSVVDKDGNLCPHADSQLSFNVSGAGSFKVVCNGNAASVEAFNKPIMKAFSGKLVLTVQATNMTGDILVEVSGDDLETAEILIKSN